MMSENENLTRKVKTHEVNQGGAPYYSCECVILCRKIPESGGVVLFLFLSPPFILIDCCSLAF